MGAMKNRYLAGPIEALGFARHKTALVSGPRQCGKTTLAKMMLEKRSLGRYCNWDEFEFRHAWARSSAPPVCVKTWKSVSTRCAAG